MKSTLITIPLVAVVIVCSLLQPTFTISYENEVKIKGLQEDLKKWDAMFNRVRMLKKEAEQKLIQFYDCNGIEKLSQEAKEYCIKYYEIESQLKQENELDQQHKKNYPNQPRRITGYSLMVNSSNDLTNRKIELYLNIKKSSVENRLKFDFLKKNLFVIEIYRIHMIEIILERVKIQREIQKLSEEEVVVVNDLSELKEPDEKENKNGTIESMEVEKVNIESKKVEDLKAKIEIIENMEVDIKETNNERVEKETEFLNKSEFPNRSELLIDSEITKMQKENIPESNESIATYKEIYQSNDNFKKLFETQSNESDSITGTVLIKDHSNSSSSNNLEYSSNNDERDDSIMNIADISIDKINLKDVSIEEQSIGSTDDLRLFNEFNSSLNDTTSNSNNYEFSINSNNPLNNSSNTVDMEIGEEEKTKLIENHDTQIEIVDYDNCKRNSSLIEGITSPIIIALFCFGGIAVMILFLKSSIFQF